jgi:hypothetical protein
MSAILEAEPDTADAHRRRLLADSDHLLEQVEQLRLGDGTVCPPDLAEAVRSLQLRLGRAEASRPRTVRAAHHLVFAVQARLMSANPRNLQPRPQPDRPAGVPRVTVLRQGGAWKFLALPAPPAGDGPGAQAEWLQLIRLTVQRALDRWSCAQDQAVNAARAREGALGALQRARAAWRNYWDLRCEAEALLSRASAAARGPATRGPAAGGARLRQASGAAASPARPP